MDNLQKDYPWTKAPLVAGAPMRLIALAAMATEISKAGGLGFVGAGSDVSEAEAILADVQRRTSSEPALRNVKDVMPVGVGFLVWAGEKLLKDSLPILEKYRPAAIWLFAPNEPHELARWTEETRRVTDGKTKVWIQVGTVSDAVEVTRLCKPDVLVIQGVDAGGHGLTHGSGLIPLLPEVDDAVQALCEKENMPKPALVAAGGILESRTAAASLTLGASGVVLGTRLLASPEANIKPGYQNAVLAASDGGITTQRGKLYDSLRGTTDWPQRYGGRSVLNRSWYDAEDGVERQELQRLHDEALKMGDAGWGEQGRLTTYAGTGVGLVKRVMGCAEIVEEVREGAIQILGRMGGKL